MTPEGKVTAAVKKYLDSLAPHCWYFKVHGSPYQKAGAPDTVGCYRGHFFAIELKKPVGGIVSPKQAHEIQLITQAGGAVAVCTSVEEVKTFISSVCKRLC
jgi:hypothetical protein